ncbi:hypothetical protein [Aureibacter tunicatorum]|uniref:Uncharacterized protein n=1 Tax=Aureibacter tunicatorum TaxID=866807 RepID=A0AAE3XMJ4_9BACT|nr:hypothetical protein [Aureibacter tunicatorum]MDR6238665.1 hypothetical protein [Aureibacter tunicatorum]BDD05404.1 hypothetical protein AUTU_28870 [Aureibacter tunicatorum]
MPYNVIKHDNVKSRLGVNKSERADCLAYKSPPLQAFFSTEKEDASRVELMASHVFMQKQKISHSDEGFPYIEIEKVTVPSESLEYLISDDMTLAVPMKEGMQAKSFFGVEEVVRVTMEMLQKQGSLVVLELTGSKMMVGRNQLYEATPKCRECVRANRPEPFEMLPFRGASCDTASMLFGYDQIARRSEFKPARPYEPRPGAVSLSDDFSEEMKKLMVILTDERVLNPEDFNQEFTKDLGKEAMVEMAEKYSLIEASSLNEKQNKSYGVNSYARPELGGALVGMYFKGEASGNNMTIANNLFAPVMAVSLDGSDFISLEQRSREALNVERLRLLLASVDSRFGKMTDEEVHMGLGGFQEEHTDFWLEAVKKMKASDDENQRAWYMDMHGTRDGQTFHDKLMEGNKEYAPLLTVSVSSGKELSGAYQARELKMPSLKVFGSRAFRNILNEFCPLPTKEETQDCMKFMAYLYDYDRLSSSYDPVDMRKRMQLLVLLQKDMHLWIDRNAIEYSHNKGVAKPEDNRLYFSILLLMDLLDEEFESVIDHIVHNANDVWMPDMMMMDMHEVEANNKLWRNVLRAMEKLSHLSFDKQEDQMRRQMLKRFNAFNARLFMTQTGRMLLQNFVRVSGEGKALKFVSDSKIHETARSEADNPLDIVYKISPFTGSLRRGKGSSVSLRFNPNMRSNADYSGVSKLNGETKFVLTPHPEYIEYGLELTKALHMMEGEVMPESKKGAVKSWTSEEDKRNILSFEKDFRKDMNLSERCNDHKVCPWTTKRPGSASLTSSLDSEENLYFDDKYFHAYSPYNSSDDESK